ncbi:MULTISPECIES: hypothetical protein [Actinomyces]|uniref:Uncharacterized protein n=1 Tax=Actinomyces marmotae TaxID=2737173 RepID=A0A6M8B442_9ACTO|nr:MULTISPECIES: hypothetical protein [Actinomyces]QKD79420.1 hypothetical protein HPC72_03375 [Actinomyces marmotae]
MTPRLSAREEKVHQGIGIDIKTPFEGNDLNVKQEVDNTFQTTLRTPAERAKTPPIPNLNTGDAPTLP